MKILQINKYHFIRGGSDVVYFNTTKLLREKGHDVHQFAMAYEQNETSEDAVFFAKNTDFMNLGLIDKIKNVSTFFYNKDAEQKLENLLQEFKPDIAHIHIFYGSLTSSILRVFKQHSVPIILSVHDYKLICPSYLFLDGKNNVCEKCKGKKYYNCVLNTCIKGNKVYSLMFALESYYRDKFYPPEDYISKFIFVSKFSRNIHINHNPQLQSKSEHIYNFDPTISKLPRKKAYRGDYYLYIGRLSVEKGLGSLLQAFKKRPQYKLKIVGDGPLRELVINSATDNIEYCGFMKGKELEDVIYSSSFVMVPSECYENNPLAIIETYSLSKPIIAADIGGITEIVQDGETGFLFQSSNVENMIEKLDKSNELSDSEYEKIALNARNFAENNFNPESHYDDLISIYKDVIAHLEISHN